MLCYNSYTNKSNMLLQIFLIGYGIVCNLLPVEKPKNTMDLPIAISFRKVLDDIVYVLRTSCQWKMLPSEFSSGSTCNKWFQQWVKIDIFKKIWTRLLKDYDYKRGIKWAWRQSIDSISTLTFSGGSWLDKIQLIEAK